ncbi:hypothetical protein Back2_20070 [Nocardioides baekrokdamisoli]|uniref:Uncharacterized protein n=1 Tax=Nocardioides baekrokdamisoli TaxID=1804624 RepID=A0A3G9IFB2_9ACTN|nr:hypothetical protein Back2_20070 [Nocardioides baekrokdamisoli]
MVQIRGEGPAPVRVTVRVLGYGGAYDPATRRTAMEGTPLGHQQVKITIGQSGVSTLTDANGVATFGFSEPVTASNVHSCGQALLRASSKSGQTFIVNCYFP